MSADIRINLRLHGEEAEKFIKIREHVGLRNDTEVIRYVLNWYYRQHEHEFEANMEHYNLNENGVVVLDKRERRLIQIYFRPEGVYCEYCRKFSCKHVNFALSIPEVQAILKSAGWKIPKRD